jgi:hypothetical protein
MVIERKHGITYLNQQAYCVVKLYLSSTNYILLCRYYFLFLFELSKIQRIVNILYFTFFIHYSNASGSKERTTSSASAAHNRGHTNTNGIGQLSSPTTPAVHDKFKDLMKLVVEPKNRRDPASFEKVIVKSEYDDVNPSLAEMMETKIR